MPRGGARVGAGRPRKEGRVRWVRKLALVPAVGSAPVSAVPTDGVAAPETLSKAARVYWDEWAPLAVAAGTLVAENVPGFALLCSESANRDALTLEGEMSPATVLRLESLRQKATKQVEQLMARYGLAAMGKAIRPPQSTEDDELAQLRQLLAVR